MTRLAGPSVKERCSDPGYPRGLIRSAVRVVVAAGLAGSVLAGCASAPPLAPTALPFPEPPHVQFFMFASQPDAICMSAPDAGRLDVYLDQLAAFHDAWESLRLSR